MRINLKVLKTMYGEYFIVLKLNLAHTADKWYELNRIHSWIYLCNERIKNN